MTAASSERRASPRYAVVGAGALGMALAARLCAAGRDVRLAARGARRTAIERGGVELTENGQTLTTHPVVVSTAEAADCDVLFLAVKSYSIPDLLAELGGRLGPGVRVIPMINGIPWWYFLGTPEHGRVVKSVGPSRLVEAIPAEQLVGAVVYTTASTSDDRSVRVFTAQRFSIGSITAPKDPVVAAIAEDLRGAGLQADVSNSLRDELWTKAAMNLATNPLSVAAGASLGGMFQDPGLLRIVERCLDEVWAIAACYGARPTLARETIRLLGAQGGDFQTSMLKDHLAGRRLELPALFDAVAELGEAHGLDLPVARTVVDIIRARENEARQRAEAESYDVVL